MNNINYKDFNNICRTCMSNCDINFNINSVISDIFHKLTDVHSETNNELPQQICLKCFDFMNEIHAFSMTCKQTHSVLMDCLNNKRTTEEQEIVEETNEQINIKDEITIEEHKIEFIKDEVDTDWETKDVTERTNDLLPPLLTKIRTENEEDRISEHPSVSETFNNHKCDQCEKSFRGASDLLRHKRVHSGERPYKCNQCGKSFAQSGNLTKHKRVHSGTRPYKCDTCCEKTFTESGALIRHKRLHSGERPYKCDQCEKLFTHSSSLITHKRLHGGARQYKCDQCEKSFTRSNNLIIHKRTHSGERSYKCEQCERIFTRINHLKSHELFHNRKVN